MLQWAVMRQVCDAPLFAVQFAQLCEINKESIAPHPLKFVDCCVVVLCPGNSSSKSSTAAEDDPWPTLYMNVTSDVTTINVSTSMGIPDFSAPFRLRIGDISGVT